MRGLLELPEILGQAGDRRRRIEHDLRAVQPERARAFGEVPVVADVDADLRERRLEHGISEVARTEIELLPESGLAVRDVRLAVLAEVLSVGVDHGGRVVVDPRLIFLVDRRHDHHPMLLRELAHQGNRRAIRYALGEVIPPCLLFGAEVRSVEELLQAEDLDLLARRLANERDMVVDHRLLDRRELAIGSEHVPRLDESAAYRPGHTNDSLIRRVVAQYVTKKPRSSSAPAGGRAGPWAGLTSRREVGSIPRCGRIPGVAGRFLVGDDRRQVEQVAVGEEGRVDADALGAAEVRAVDEWHAEAAALRQPDVARIGGLAQVGIAAWRSWQRACPSHRAGRATTPARRRARRRG